jgi:uncharacterized protein (TIGR02453 family)
MGFTEAYYEFFIVLSSNNNKTWFDVHRTEYEQEVKGFFQQFVGSVLEKVAAIDARFGDVQPKDCIFRINKDIRFSKDKSPYKLHCSAAIQLGGRKQMSAGGMYIEFGPELCAIYSGVYLPEKDNLRLIRERIAADPKGFEEIIKDNNFVQIFGEVLGEKNKRIEADLMVAAKEQRLIFNKQFYVRHLVEPEDTMADDFDDYVVKVWNASRAYNDFIGGF